LKKYPSR